MNRIFLMGRLTKNPETRMTQSETEVAGICIAVERQAKAGDEKKTDFINCVAFNKTAEFLRKYFVKGQKILIAGRLQIEPWNKDDGTTQMLTKVIISDVYFCENKQEHLNTERREQSTQSGFIEMNDDRLTF